MNTTSKSLGLDAVNTASSPKRVTAFIEAYIVYSGIIKNKNKLKFKDFLGNQVQDIEQLIDQDFFFLDKERALKHVTCLSDSHGMLKVYIPESAIAGFSDHLILMPGALQVAYIHGYYPGWAKGQIYYKNPEFDHQILKFAKSIILEETL